MDRFARNHTAVWSMCSMNAAVREIAQTLTSALSSSGRSSLFISFLFFFALNIPLMETAIFNQVIHNKQHFLTAHTLNLLLT